MGSNQVLLSIVTPAYNRGELLKKCFLSLLEQTDKSFEWIIVDDGSSDDSWQVITGFQADFPIICVHKDNGGKHSALNASHAHIHGEYVLILDSDDYLTDTAVEQVRRGWSKFAGCGEVGILTFLKGSSPENPNCTGPVANEPVDILRCKRNIIHSSDCCEVIRAELFKKYPFPVFEGERFVAECALWNRVALTHKCVYIHEVIYICEYLQGGLTDSGRAMRIRNPQGGMFTSNLRMHRKNYFTQRVKYGLLYCCYGFFAGLSITAIMRKDPSNYWLKMLCMFPGYGIYLLWKR